MVKRLIQRYLPSLKSIQEKRSLRFFGSAIYAPTLWHFNRRSVASAFFIGIFCAFLPIPFQMVVAAFLSLLFRCNIPLSIALVWITNPVTMPFIFYFTYRVGCLLLQVPPHYSSVDLSLEGISVELARIWKPLYLGSIVSGIIISSFCYVMIRLYWRCNILYLWRKRRERRQSKLNR
ncbi:MAG: DUF2062 domain-containing protein [Endozoicomonas sp. (ex Botrylloides leachii)]|nr:DUF2062 domain-containing protein [Endozoicomonas sp. (ex Botrylloides leachii)]